MGDDPDQRTQVGKRLPAGAPPAKRPPPPPPAAPPESIGPYRVIKLLGEGGMGAVYECEQDHPTRRVAVKVIRKEGRETTVRFSLEIETLARLAHPGIGAIYDAGDDGGRLYFAMELVLGERIDEAARKLDARQRLALVAEVCDAVHHAHAKGVIHRDLKPANILVADGKAKVLDFGIARIVDTAPDARHTQTGMLLGTPPYMSPEQADEEDADARSDVYALGVIAYELVAGSLPYDSDKTKTLGGLFRAIRDGEVVPLSRRRPELAGDVEVILAKALAREAATRYQSAAAFGDDLRRWLADESILARPPSRRELLLRFARKNRALTATAAALLMALVIGTITATALYLRADRALDALAARNRDLTLVSAHAELDVDPTQTVTTLATLPSSDPRAVDLARQALDRGVARLVLAGHTSEVRSIAFAPDGTHAATVGYDRTVRIWDLTARTARTLLGHSDQVAFALYSPAGTLFSGGADGLRFWGTDGSESRLLDAGAVDQAAFSPDGKTLAVAGQLAVSLWSSDGAALPPLAGPDKRTTLVAWSPDGKTLAAATSDGGIWVWDLPGPARKLGAHALEVTGLAFTTGGILVSTGRDGDVRRWDHAGMSLVLENAVDVSGLACAASCVWADRDGRLTLWDESGMRHVRGHDGVVRTIAFAPGGRVFASGGDDRTVRLWEVASGAQLVLRGHRSRVRMVAFSADGKQLASATNDGTVRVWDAESPDWRLAHEGSTLTVAFAGARLASMGADGRVRVFTLDGSAAPLTLPGSTEGSATLAFSASAGGRVVGAGRERTIHVWDATGGARTLTAPARVVRVELFGDWLAAATLAGPIPVWNLADGRELLLDGHTERLNDLRFRSDGKLVSASDDDTVRLWDLDLPVPTGTIVAQFPEHVTSLAVAPDGSIAAAGNGGIIRVYASRADGTLDPAGVELRGHEGRVLALAFSTTGTLASGGHDGTVRLWGRDFGAGAARRGGTILWGGLPVTSEVPIASVVWGQDTVFSAAEDQVVRAFAPDGTARVVGTARRLAASANGAWIAGASDDGLVRLWPVAARAIDLDKLTATIQSQ